MARQEQATGRSLGLGWIPGRLGRALFRKRSERVGFRNPQRLCHRPGGRRSTLIHHFLLRHFGGREARLIRGLNWGRLRRRNRPVRGLRLGRDGHIRDPSCRDLARLGLQACIVKRFFRQRSGSTPAGSRHRPVAAQGPAPTFEKVAKPVGPSEAEIARNPRSRSARLRSAIRTSAPAWQHSGQKISGDRK